MFVSKTCLLNNEMFNWKVIITKNIVFRVKKKSWLIHYKNSSVISTKLSDSKRNFFINDFLNHENILVSDVYKDKESFSKFWVTPKRFVSAFLRGHYFPWLLIASYFLFTKHTWHKSMQHYPTIRCLFPNYETTVVQAGAFKSPIV